ncbi:unnamed protein product [Chrysoparadoxa australica]
MASKVAADFKDGLFCLVNNAGVGLDLPYQGSKAEMQVVSTTLNTNFWGLKGVTEALLPHLKKGSGKIVNISSGAAAMNMERMAESRRLSLLSAGDEDEQAMGMEGLTGLVNEFTQVYDTMAETKGEELPCLGEGLWLQSYGFSKAVLNAYTRILAKQHKDIHCYACTPGFVSTDMTQAYKGSFT